MIPHTLLLFTLLTQDAPRIAAASEALVGKPAPAVSLELVNGPHFDLASQKGKIVFLAFWATWCEPCRRDIPLLIAARAEYKSRGLVVIGVNAEAPAAVRDYLARENFALPTALDPDEKISKAYGIDLLPRLFVINQEGIVVRMIRGLPGEGTIRKVLDPLLPAVR